MRVTVSSIPEAGIQQQLKLPLTVNDLKLEGDVHVALNLNRVGERVLAQGRVEAMSSLVCSRCLNVFPYPVDARFNIAFTPYAEFAGEEEHELSKEELDVISYRNDEINIDELIKEQIFLSVPMKPLCKPECRGICPRCGTNLNEKRCGCSIKEADERFAPLKKLKDSLEKG